MCELIKTFMGGTAFGIHEIKFLFELDFENLGHS